jgi:hypothetical protein
MVTPFHTKKMWLQNNLIDKKHDKNLYHKTLPIYKNIKKLNIFKALSKFLRRPD